MENQALVDLYKAASLGLQVLIDYIDSPNVPVIMEDAEMARRSLEDALWELRQELGGESE